MQTHLIHEDIVKRFQDYIWTNPTGGSLHIVLDDLNLEDHHVEWCIAHAKSREDVEGVELGLILLDMPMDDRKTISELSFE